eukprot:gene5891-2611_t
MAQDNGAPMPQPLQQRNGGRHLSMWPYLSGKAAASPRTELMPCAC